jgi:hypothetical protein
MVFLICLETVPIRQIPAFQQRLEALADGFHPVTRETWLVGSIQHDVGFWTNQLQPLIGQNDTLLIAEITSSYGGVGAAPIWHWLDHTVANHFIAEGTPLFEGE